MNTSMTTVSSTSSTALYEASRQPSQEVQTRRDLPRPQAVQATPPQPPSRQEQQSAKKLQAHLDPESRRRAVEEAVAEVNRQIQASSARNLNFTVDDVAKRTVISVRNKESGELIRQIPPDVILRVAHGIEHMRGMMVDKEA